MRNKNLNSTLLSPANLFTPDGKLKLVIATKNKDKIREIKKLLQNLPVSILPFDGKSPPETGKTLAENSAIKALNAARTTGYWSIADDTGLEVDALNGLPGVNSARFASRKGHNATYEENVRKLLKVMKGVPPKKRKARFKTAVCIATPDGKIFIKEGVCHGFIAQNPVGENGFGYDPVFFYPPYKKTFAQMSLHEKNSVSHRSRAFNKAAKLLKKLIADIRS